MQMMFPKNMMVLTTTFVLTSMTYAETNVTFVDGFEASLLYVKTECGFYDKKTKLTWSVKSYECPPYQQGLWNNYHANQDMFCLFKVKEEFNKENPNCLAKAPRLAQLLTLLDKTKSPAIRLPNVAIDGVTIAYPSSVDPNMPTCTANPCLSPNGIHFGRGNQVYKISDKRYARLVMTS